MNFLHFTRLHHVFHRILPGRFVPISAKVSSFPWLGKMDSACFLLLVLRAVDRDT